MSSRNLGFGLLQGEGIEIGALHEPAAIPGARKITYVDAISQARARELFREVDPTRFVSPEVIADLDHDGLRHFPDSSLDFVVICHVLEHLANPLQAVAEIFRVLKPGGLAAIAIPDKRFTFDQPRALTPFNHLWQDYLDRREESPDDHYLDFLLATTTFIAHLSPADQAEHIARAKARREHSHVWDSESFEETLLLTIPLTGHRAQLRYCSGGDANWFEYFSIWQKIV